MKHSMRWLTEFSLALVWGLFTAGCDSGAGSATTGGAGPSSYGKNRDQARGTPNAEPPKQAIWPRQAQVKTDSPPMSEDKLPQPRGEPEPKSSETKPPRMEEEEMKEIPPEKDPPIPQGLKALNKEGTLLFEKTADDKRRVHILAEVCLREGQLEVLLCRANTKEHEAILRAEVDARDIHFALIAAGAKPGTTVKYVPEYKPATGDMIQVTLTYHLGGKLITRPAQHWIQHARTKKEMEHGWVFAGSRFFKSPDDPTAPPFYCANNGEIISVANFPDSMLDLPVKSSKEQAELGYIPITDRIPPLKTKVLITLEVQKQG